MTTLSQLQTSVDSWLARDDVAVSGSDFDQILLIAESSIARDFCFANSEVTATLNFTGRSADLPSDLIEVRNVWQDVDGVKLEYMTPQALRESPSWNRGRVGAFYTLEGNNASSSTSALQMTIAAPASATAPVDIVVNYLARLPALTTPTSTNHVLTNHYDVYLYACLAEACGYLQEDALEDRYRAKYDMLVAKHAILENRKRFGAVPKQTYGFPRAIV